MILLRVLVLFVLVCSSLISCSGKTKAISNNVNKLKGNLKDMRNIDAEQTGEIASLRQTIRELSGRIETLERNQQQLSLRQSSSYPPEDNSYRGNAAVQSPVFNENVTSTAIDIPNLAFISDQRLAVQHKINGDENFYNALTSIGEGNFSNALNLLNSVDLSRPSTPISTAGFISFWKAVAFEGTGKPYEALRHYGELVNNTPNHKRAGLALLRQSKLFISLKDYNTAKIALQKLVNQYPNTKEAFEAKQLLINL